MIAQDEDALICDFAEVYHIYDYKSLPTLQAAIFAYGLEEDSRIRKRLSGSNATYNTLLQAAMVDSLNFIAWTKTKDAEKGKNRPQSMVSLIFKPGNDVEVFASAEAFDERWGQMAKEKGGK